MENEILDPTQITPSVEKISLSDINQAKISSKLEKKNSATELVKSMIALNPEEREKAVNYVNKKFEKLLSSDFIKDIK